MEKNELTFKQEKACHYIVGGLGIKDTADLVGVTEQTVFRWMRLSEFQAQIRSLRRLVIENSVNDLLQLNKRAVKTLEALLDCDNQPTRCRAAVAILTKSHESIDFFEYSERLRLIEQKFSENR